MGMSEAGVAIILRSLEPVECLFIKRVVSPTDPWSGHIAFPGGRRKEGDRDILDTIYREVLEEVSIDLRSDAELIYRLPPTFPGNMPELKVHPYVFRLTRDVDIKPGMEVERFYWISLMDLSIESVLMDTHRGKRMVEAYVYRGSGEHVVIWGMTKRILDSMFSHMDRILTGYRNIY